MADAPFIPLEFRRLDEGQMRARAAAFAAEADRRRSVRSFSPEPVPLEVLEDCIRAAGTAPSGAHKQPWTFALVTNPELKSRIRAAAEEEERANYSGRMNDEWLADLQPFGLDWQACTEAVQLILPDGRVRSGAFAVNAFLWRLPRWRLLVAALYLLFPLIPFEILGYWLVARNRHRIRKETRPA